MKKILILSNHFITLHLFRQELIDKLLGENYEVILSIPEDEDNFFKNKGCKIINVPVDRRGINPFKDFKLLIKYFKAIHKHKPNVVLTYTVKPNLYGGICCKLLNIPYISNITGLGAGMNKGTLLKLLIKTLYKLALNKKANIFVQNEENLRALSEMKINTPCIQLIPGSGVNLDKHRYIDYPQSNTIDFFFIARVMKEKGIEEYIQAAKHCKDKKYNTKFHIFGFCEEDYINTLNDLEQQGILIYHGMCNNIAEQQKINHCTIHPSYHEGMSNVLLETAASGRPCICSDIPGCREIVDDGKSGFLFEVKNTKQLIECIEKFLALSNEQKKEMGINARHKVEKEFDRDIVVNTYIQKINELL